MVKAANKLLQSQRIFDVLIASASELELREEKSLLGEEYVNNISSAHFIPGLGRFFVTAAFNRDYTMVLGTVLFYACLIIILNLVVDIIQASLDPKSRDK